MPPSRAAAPRPVTPARPRGSAAVAKDLQGAGGEAAVVVGQRLPAAVHALGHAINAAIKSNAVSYTAAILPTYESLSALADEIKGGRVDTLVITAWNPSLLDCGRRRLRVAPRQGAERDLPRQPRGRDRVPGGVDRSRAPTSSRAGATGARPTAPSRCSSRSSSLCSTASASPSCGRPSSAKAASAATTCCARPTRRSTRPPSSARCKRASSKVRRCPRRPRRCSRARSAAPSTSWARRRAGSRSTSSPTTRSSTGAGAATSGCRSCPIRSPSSPGTTRSSSRRRWAAGSGSGRTTAPRSRRAAAR